MIIDDEVFAQISTGSPAVPGKSNVSNSLGPEIWQPIVCWPYLIGTGLEYERQFTADSGCSCAQVAPPLAIKIVTTEATATVSIELP